MNYHKLCKPYHKDALLTLSRLCSIESVHDESTVEEGAPFGEGVKKALGYVADFAEHLGFEVDRCDGYCTEISYGDEEGPLVGIYAHADVVPATGEWKYPPFEATLDNGILYARGSSDDKGPLVAAFYAMKALKDNGLIRGYKVRMVVGGNEETGSQCLKYYFGKLGKKHCDYGFTPDSDFPLIYAEKGTAPFTAHKDVDLSPITKMEGGAATNAVCDKLDVYLPRDEKLIANLKEKKIEFVEDGEGKDYHITFLGKSAHGSTPERGVNAAIIAFGALGSFYDNAFLRLLETLLKDHNGRNFGGYNDSPELGESTYNYGIVSYDGKKLSFTVDYRYGESANPEEAVECFEKKTTMKVEREEGHKILLYPLDSPLVKTLMRAYRKGSHDLFSKPLAIGGGTYAKECDNTVAFGSAFKNHPGDIHSPNEYMYLKDFHKQMEIYARAIHMLGRLS